MTGEPLFWDEGQLEVWKQRDGWCKLGPHRHLGLSQSPQPRLLPAQNPSTHTTWLENYNRVVPAPHWPPEVTAPSSPPVPGRCWQSAPALSPPSRLASACVAAQAPAWASTSPHPLRGLPGKTFSGIRTMTHFHTHICRNMHCPRAGDLQSCLLIGLGETQGKREMARSPPWSRTPQEGGQSIPARLGVQECHKKPLSCLLEEGEPPGGEGAHFHQQFFSPHPPATPCSRLGTLRGRGSSPLLPDRGLRSRITGTRMD